MGYQDFINQYNGQSCDFDGAYGAQCVDLVQFYNRDVVGGPILIGDGAVNIWDTYPQDSYDRIDNTPDNSPTQGDIIIWGTGVGGGYGHIAICQAADVNGFTSFDQNWPLGSPCHFQTHDYSNVLGWLHPKKPEAAEMVQVPSDTFKELVRKSTLYDAFNTAGYASVDDLLGKLAAIQNTNTQLTKDVLTAKQQASDQAALAKQAHDEDITAVQASLDAQHALSPYQQFRQMVCDALGLPLNTADGDVHTAIGKLKQPDVDAAKVHEQLGEALIANSDPIKPVGRPAKVASQPRFVDQLASFWHQLTNRFSGA